MAEHFDRWTPWYFGSSWALRLFVAHHTELNDLYWAHEPAARFATKQLRRQQPGTSPAEALGFSGVDEGRLAPSVDLWEKSYTTFRTWVRVSALSALSSYFEIYLKTIATLAIESDPGAPRGASRRIDGAVLLKYGAPASSADVTKGLVIGEWSSRLKSYKKLFGSIPRPLQHLEGDLERLRRLRNDAGHKFGRDMKEEDYRCRMSPVPMTNVGLQALKKHLGAVDQAARAIDSHLASQHVGAYEMVYFYHLRRNDTMEPGNHVRKLKKALGQILGVGPSREYCQELKAYYEGL